MFPIYNSIHDQNIRLLLRRKKKNIRLPSTTWSLSIMMMRGRGEILLLLIVCAIVFLQPPVMGKFPTCTTTQKREILARCRKFILHQESSVSVNSPCCDAVRMVPNRNMLCVISLLSDNEKKRFNQQRIRSLQDLCKHRPW